MNPQAGIVATLFPKQNTITISCFQWIVHRVADNNSVIWRRCLCLWFYVEVGSVNSCQKLSLDQAV